MIPKPHTAPPTDCDAISEAFLALHEQDGFTRLPPSSLLHDSVPMSFVMSAGLIQVENDLEKIVEETGGKFAFTQPCFRHFDMKQVGEDPTRLSLFHMSAAFHIGCSERETVLPRLWHFLTEVLGLEKDRLWVTYLDDAEFGRDEASYQCWKALGVDESRLVGLDQQHCFWRQRSLGQIASDGKKCGPHTEVFYERDVVCPACENSEQPIGACRCGRFVEISNSLFIENYVADDGSLIPADTVFAECVVGLERLGMILQGVDSVYRTRRFQRWREQLILLIPQPWTLDTEIVVNIVLDHLLAFVKLAEDGAPAPGRGGRRYIMRKLVRTALLQIMTQGWNVKGVLDVLLSSISQAQLSTLLLKEYHQLIKNSWLSNQALTPASFQTSTYLQPPQRNLKRR
jgi:alanyl-tRNA synthetase